MNILSPLTRIEETKPLIDAGADEFYCGVFSKEWEKRFTNLTGPNRFETKFANFRNFDDLKKAIEIADSNNVPVFLAMNMLYSENLYPLVLKEIDKGIKAGIKAIIIADFTLLLKLQKRNSNIDIHISTGGTAFNSETIKFYKELGASRIVLPRHLTIEEIKNITKKTKIELETFILNGKCMNIDGFCTFHHHINEFTRPKLNNLLQRIESNDFLMSTIRKTNPLILKKLREPNIVGSLTACWLNYDVMANNLKIKDPIERKKKEKIAEKRFEIIFNKLAHKACGACTLYDFNKIKIKSVKIIGRHDPIEKKKKDVLFLGHLKDVLTKKNLSRSEFIAYTKKYFYKMYKTPCTILRCYSPQTTLTNQ